MSALSLMHNVVSKSPSQIRKELDQQVQAKRQQEEKLSLMDKGEGSSD
jgi:hypothetical protein